MQMRYIDTNLVFWSKLITAYVELDSAGILDLTTRVYQSSIDWVKINEVRRVVEVVDNFVAISAMGVISSGNVPALYESVRRGGDMAPSSVNSIDCFLAHSFSNSYLSFLSTGSDVFTVISMMLN